MLGFYLIQHVEISYETALNLILWVDKTWTARLIYGTPHQGQPNFIFHKNFHK